MSLGRRALAGFVGLALLAAPTTGAAETAAAARAELPPAAYTDAPEPALRAPAGRSVASTRPEAPARRPAEAPAREAASVGASLYVDGCATPNGTDAFDIRRTQLKLTADRATAILTLRACSDEPPLTTITGQSFVWRTSWTALSDGEHDHEFVVADDGSGLALTRDGAPVAGSKVVVEQPVAGVTELVARMPVTALDLPPDCDPSGTSCLRLTLSSLDTAGSTRDTLPDDDAEAPYWPSRCRPDIDPSAAGHVRLKTRSTAEAATVAREIEEAGYPAVARDDAPYVEVTTGASPDVVSVLETWDEVVEVVPVATRRMTAVSDDPKYPQQWYLPRLGLPAAWEERTGSGVGVAIVDNGVAADRPDLAGRVTSGWDAMTGQLMKAGVHSDLGGHGTAVAGLAVGDGGDGTGMAGVDWSARIVPVRVFDHEGCFVSEPRYLDALDWLAAAAAAGRVKVANFSLGGGAIPGEAAAIERIVRNGAAVVAAMGNNGDRTGSTPSYPAALPDVIAVGATGPEDEVAGYSNRGRHLDVVAPGGDQSGRAGGDILTLADPVAVGPSDPFAPLAGTSFSSPLVAGVAALYMGEHAEATPADVTRALLTTANDLGGQLAGFDIAYGFGIVDAGRALTQPTGRTLTRIAGEDRYATAAATSRRAFPNPDLVDMVLVATGENYPDALAGGPLAAREKAPLLLTPRDGLHPATTAELLRLDPDRVLVLGGENVVSSAVEEQIRQLGHEVERAAGGDRYATAREIAVGRASGTWRAWSASDVVYLATGRNFPDALPGGAAAASWDAPLLLTEPDAIPEPTRRALADLRPSVVVVLGGEAVIGAGVVAELDDMGIRVERAAGESRYETAIAALCPSPSLCRANTRFAVVATGEGFADALGGSAAAAALRAPLLLVPRTGPLPDVLRDAMDVVRPEQMIVLGGQVPVPDAMADQVAELAVR